jgi:tetratricopeptide (TPR) repeat protein
MRVPRFLSILFLSAAFALPSLAVAQSKLEEEATRQLGFARSELENGNFEKALASSDSAIRLNPALYDAYMYRALAYEGLGDNKVAEGLLITYLEVDQQKNQDSPEVIENHKAAAVALERIQEKLGEPGSWGSPNYAADGVGGGVGLAAPADMPGYPLGSEEFLEWMVSRQQWDVYETRTQVGAGLAAGGLGLAGVGGGLIAGMSVLSAKTPNDANVEAFYAAGIASVFVGGTMAAIGLPMVGVNASRLGRMRKAADAKKSALRPRLEVRGLGLAFRF